MADHDPYCPVQHLPSRLQETLWRVSACRCDEIARVRADERERIEKFAIPAWREEIAQEIEARIDDNPYYEPWREAMEFAAAIARGGAQ